MSRPTWDGVKAKIERGEALNDADRRMIVAVAERIFADGLKRGRHEGDLGLMDAASEGRAMLRFLSPVIPVPHTGPSRRRRAHR